MNYLAHLFLAENNKYSLVGNLLGDFINGKIDQSYPEDIKKGVFLHRQVDKFTDSHLIVKQSKKRIDKTLSKFSGILIDVFYDHFLVINWDRYSSIPFEKQIEKWNSMLVFSDCYNFPQRLLQTLDRFKNHDLLARYKKEKGIRFALLRISERIRFTNNLVDGMDDFNKHYNALNKDFNLFFPELIQYVESVKDSHYLPSKSVIL